MTDNHDHESIPGPSAPAISPLAACEAELVALLARYRCAIVPVLVVKQVGRGLPTEALIATDWRLVPQE